jgi:hypothetical protein
MAEDFSIGFVLADCGRHSINAFEPSRLCVIDILMGRPACVNALSAPCIYFRKGKRGVLFASGWDCVFGLHTTMLAQQLW